MDKNLKRQLIKNLRESVEDAKNNEKRIKTDISAGKIGLGVGSGIVGAKVAGKVPGAVKKGYTKLNTRGGNILNKEINKYNNRLSTSLFAPGGEQSEYYTKILDRLKNIKNSKIKRLLTGLRGRVKI